MHIKPGQDVKKILREVNTLSRMHNEHVVRYYQSWIERDDRGVSPRFQSSTDEASSVPLQLLSPPAVIPDAANGEAREPSYDIFDRSSDPADDAPQPAVWRRGDGVSSEESSDDDGGLSSSDEDTDTSWLRKHGQTKTGGGVARCDSQSMLRQVLYIQME